MMFVNEHNKLLERITIIKNLINPNVIIRTDRTTRIIETTSINLSSTENSIDKSKVIFSLRNFGVDFNYVCFYTDTNMSLPSFMLVMNYGMMNVLLDEHYHLVDDSLLKELIKISNTITLGDVVKDCNYHQRGE